MHQPLSAIDWIPVDKHGIEGMGRGLLSIATTPAHRHATKPSVLWICQLAQSQGGPLSGLLLQLWRAMVAYQQGHPSTALPTLMLCDASGAWRAAQPAGFEASGTFPTEILSSPQREVSEEGEGHHLLILIGEKAPSPPRHIPAGYASLTVLMASDELTELRWARWTQLCGGRSYTQLSPARGSDESQRRWRIQRVLKRLCALGESAPRTCSLHFADPKSAHSCFQIQPVPTSLSPDAQGSYQLALDPLERERQLWFIEGALLPKDKGPSVVAELHFQGRTFPLAIDQPSGRHQTFSTAAHFAAQLFHCYQVHDQLWTSIEQGDLRRAAKLLDYWMTQSLSVLPSHKLEACYQLKIRLISRGHFAQEDLREILRLAHEPLAWMDRGGTWELSRELAPAAPTSASAFPSFPMDPTL